MAESKCVLVTNICPQLDDTHIRELFECCGKIASLTMSSTQPRFCEITFADSAHAKAASFLSNTPLGDRNLQVVIKENTPAPMPAAVAPTNEEEMFGDPMLSGPLRVAAEKRMREIACTIYVGNVDCSVDEDTFRKFFAPCGPIAHVKIAGDTLGKPSRFGFIEYLEPEHAQAAIGLNGAVLADRPLKVGKANNSIFKPSNVAAANKNPEKSVSEIMKKVLAATAKIGNKDGSRSRSRSRSRGRRRRRSRSRSRDRDRSRRSKRSRSRDRSRRGRSRSKDKDRSSRTKYGNAKMDDEDKPKKAEQPDRTGMFFDGYTWNPIADLESGATNIPITTQAAYMGAKGVLPITGLMNSMK